jgi:hypothetical protein
MRPFSCIHVPPPKLPNRNDKAIGFPAGPRFRFVWAISRILSTFSHFVWSSFVVRFQIVFGSFFDTFIDSKGLFWFVPSKLTSFLNFLPLSRTFKLAPREQLPAANPHARIGHAPSKARVTPASGVPRSGGGPPPRKVKTGCTLESIVLGYHLAPYLSRPLRSGLWRGQPAPTCRGLARFGGGILPASSRAGDGKPSPYRS